MVHLKHLTGLRELDLACTTLSDACIEHFEQIKGLTELNMIGTGITDAGISLLMKLTGLRKSEAFDKVLES